MNFGKQLIDFLDKERQLKGNLNIDELETLISNIKGKERQNEPGNKENETSRMIKIIERFVIEIKEFRPYIENMQWEEFEKTTYSFYENGEKDVAFIFGYFTGLWNKKIADKCFEEISGITNNTEKIV